MDKISIVVPCYNEEESIEIFYNETMKVLKSIKQTTYEFVFVNDGSKDRTLEIFKTLHKKDKNVKFISFSRNFGKEAAMLAGFDKASGDFVTTMDVDLQDPPELLVEMYRSIKEEGYDCVATRSKSRKSYSPLRKFFTKSFYKIINKMSDVEIVDGARDFRLMKRKMVKAITSMREVNRFSKGLFGYAGFKTKWIEYEDRDRVAGSSKWSFMKLFKYALEGIISFSTTPLLYSVFIGLFFCLLAFIFVIVIIIKTLAFSDPVSGWPSLACIILFVSGIQLFCTGIIGTYLSKIYLEAKDRPIYIVSETEEDV